MALGGGGGGGKKQNCPTIWVVNNFFLWTLFLFTFEWMDKKIIIFFLNGQKKWTENQKYHLNCWKIAQFLMLGLSIYICHVLFFFIKKKEMSCHVSQHVSYHMAHITCHVAHILFCGSRYIGVGGITLTKSLHSVSQLFLSQKPNGITKAFEILWLFIDDKKLYSSPLSANSALHILSETILQNLNITFHLVLESRKCTNFHNLFI